MNMALQDVRFMENILFQEKLPYFTTPYLMSLFADYKSPRDKIKNSKKNGSCITSFGDRVNALFCVYSEIFVLSFDRPDLSK